MAHVVDRPIQVRCGRDGRPQAFRWQGRWLWIDQLLDEWVYQVPWWRQQGPAGAAPDRTFYRVCTKSGGVYELAEEDDGQFVLHRVY